MNENNLTKLDYFELRTKRLTIVYKILYAFVAAWLAMLITAINGLNDKTFAFEDIPSITFFISSLTFCIIQMLSYILLEFRCMKIVDVYDEKLWKETEQKYDNIWNAFGIILCINLLCLLISTYFIDSISMINNIMTIGLIVVSFIYTVKNVVYLFAYNKWQTFWKWSNIISILISPIFCYLLTFLLMEVFLK